jgi:uncharacterized repeat protein (TIGR03803 family)
MRDTVLRSSWISRSLATASPALALALVLVAAAFVAQPAEAQTFTVLYAFTGSPTDGAYPDAGLVMDAKGDLYGTTSGGGSANNGTIFEVTGEGQETVLYNFTGGTDGSESEATLVLLNGTLFGTTDFGGTHNYGTVFELNSKGKEAAVSFTGSNGENPFAGLVISAGNGYGTTYYGGTFGQGTVFKVTSSGKVTALHSFTGGAMDGANPWAGLVVDAKGNLYGTTSVGGTYNLGTVFEVTPAGEETVLHSFSGGTTDGARPEAGLIVDANGNFYGTTVVGGVNNYGTVFELNSQGQETVLYSFAGMPTDGAYPYASLVMDANGNFYGSTDEGGSSNYGTVFELNSQDQETVLHSFTGGADGGEPPWGDLILAKGNLYGTASQGGHGLGTVWMLQP